MAQFNSPDVEKIKQSKEDLEKKIQKFQEIGLPSIKDIPKTIWEKLIMPNLLTKRQIAKKVLMIQGQLYSPPMSEERAQIIIYGKAYYKNGKLYDNDEKDPNCLAKPGEKNNRDASFYFIPPIDENHPMIEKIKSMIKEIKDKLIQLGIKLGEFLFALPQAIITIVTSLIALVSSVIILPFGSGIPTAITSVMTMVKTIKDLQARTEAILPLLGVIDTIGLILPKKCQFIIAQLNIIVVILLTILKILTSIIGLLDKVMSALKKSKNKMDDNSKNVTANTSSNPTSIKAGESSKLSASASGGNWEYTYQWTDQYGNVISNEEEVTVTPTKTTTYNCRITDGNGKIKDSSVTVKVT